MIGATISHDLSLVVAGGILAFVFGLACTILNTIDSDRPTERRDPGGHVRRVERPYDGETQAPDLWR